MSSRRLRDDKGASWGVESCGGPASIDGHGATGLGSGGGTYGNEGYVLIADWHGLTCRYVESDAVIECLYGCTQSHIGSLI